MTRPVLFLVEDNPANLLLLDLAFAEYGCAVDVFHVPDGLAALEFLGDPANHARFPVLLIDLNLRGPIMGLALTKGIRVLPCSIPIVVWSGSANPRDRQRSLDAGANAYFGKPSDFGSMHGLIATLAPYLFPNHPHLPELAHV